MNDGKTVDYDYLVIATGPKLAFDEVEGLGPHGGHTYSVCHVDHAMKSHDEWDDFCKKPGPIVVGAVQGASCFGPAYEYAFIMETDLRKRKIRTKVPMTFVTAEPYIGHLGLGGVGDSKGILESGMRDKRIKWICNAKVTKVEAGKMFVTEHDDMGVEKKKHELPFGYSMMLPAFKGVDAVFGIEGLVQARGFVIVDKHQRNPKYKNIFAVGVCVAIPPVEATPDPVRYAQDRLHDRIHGDRYRSQHSRRSHQHTGRHRSNLERGMSGRLRRKRRSLRCDTADPSTQRELVLRRQVGASRQGRVREILHPQNEERHFRTVLRRQHPEDAGH